MAILRLAKPPGLGVRIMTFVAVLVVIMSAAHCALATDIYLSGDSFGEFAKGTVIVNAPWGKEPGQIGLQLEPEMEPQGAMSFAVGKDKSIYILDQINQRVQRFDAKGAFVESLPTGRRQVDNIAVSDNGVVYVLDAILSRKVWELGAKGPTGTSWQLPDIGSFKFATNLTAESGGLWIEDSHTKSYQLTRDGKNLTADAVLSSGVIGRKGIGSTSLKIAPERVNKSLVRVTGSGPQPFTLDIHSKRDILAIDNAGTDLSGRIYLALLLYKEGPAPEFATLASCYCVVCLGTDGTLVGRLDVPETVYTESRFRIFFGDDGTIYQLQTDKTGVRVLSYKIGSGGLSQ